VTVAAGRAGVRLDNERIRRTTADATTNPDQFSTNSTGVTRYN
jgi:hypothetical protein